MKKFKIIDFWISFVLITIFIILSLVCIVDNDFILTVLLSFYFFVGSWHTLSMIIHTWKKWFMLGWGARKIYHVASLALLITLPASLDAVMILTPFMAIFYTYICYRETYIKMKRPLDDLK